VRVEEGSYNGIWGWGPFFGEVISEFILSWEIETKWIRFNHEISFHNYMIGAW